MLEPDEGKLSSPVLRGPSAVSVPAVGLCSIPDPQKALHQMKRVLKPDGRLIFLEHGRAPDAGVAAWQDRLNPTWKRIGRGCHLNRKIDELLTQAGFHVDELKKMYLPGPRPMTYTYQGFAHVE